MDTLRLRGRGETFGRAINMDEQKGYDAGVRHARFPEPKRQTYRAPAQRMPEGISGQVVPSASRVRIRHHA